MRRGDIAYIRLPLVPGSHIQSGRRPAALVIADNSPSTNPMTMIVPFTSQLASLRFPFTFQVEPSQQNGLTAISVALVLQLCAVDQTYLDSVIGHLEDNYLSLIDEHIKRMLSV